MSGETVCGSDQQQLNDSVSNCPPHLSTLVRYTLEKTYTVNFYSLPEVLQFSSVSFVFIAYFSLFHQVTIPLREEYYLPKYINTFLSNVSHKFSNPQSCCTLICHKVGRWIVRLIKTEFLQYHFSLSELTTLTVCLNWRFVRICVCLKYLPTLTKRPLKWWLQCWVSHQKWQWQGKLTFAVIINLIQLGNIILSCR